MICHFQKQKIIIRSLRSREVNWQNTIVLIRGAFGNLTKQGIDTPTAYITKEILEKRQNTHCFFAYADNELIGCILGKLFSNSTCYIDILAVLPQYQSNGVGKLLLKTFENNVFPLGIKYIWLDTMAVSKINIKWYQKSGYLKYGLRNYTRKYFSIIFRKYQKNTWWAKCKSHIRYMGEKFILRVMYKDPQNPTLIGILLFNYKK